MLTSEEVGRLTLEFARTMIEGLDARGDTEGAAVELALRIHDTVHAFVLEGVAAGVQRN